MPLMAIVEFAEVFGFPAATVESPKGAEGWEWMLILASFHHPTSSQF